MSETKPAPARPWRVTCPLGGPAPCIDDLCHGGGRTLCGLEWYRDFCEHGYDPEECPYGCRDDEDDWLYEGQGDEP